MESYNLVDIRVISTRPTHVEYSLTEIGADLTPILMAMYHWVFKHAQQKINNPTN
jgi:DNA-binding HxlR family transcriptional regulator